jgi:hypothetical protein
VVAANALEQMSAAKMSMAAFARERIKRGTLRRKTVWLRAIK